VLLYDEQVSILARILVPSYESHDTETGWQTFQVPQLPTAGPDIEKDVSKPKHN